MSFHLSFEPDMNPRSTCEICGRDYPPAKVRRIMLPEWCTGERYSRWWCESMCVDCAMFYQDRWRFIIA